MKAIIFLVILASMVVAGAQTPLDAINHIKAPQVIDLQHVSPESPKTIAAMNEHLTNWKPTMLEDLGHYSSQTRYVNQSIKEQIGFSSDLKNWSDLYIPITPSVQKI